MSLRVNLNTGKLVPGPEERKARALERIADALEKLCQENHNQ